MPRYQYACPDCGNQFEAQQKFTDKPLKKCPTCGKRSIHRVVGLVAVSFKGTGFYVNDSKNGSNGKTAAKPEVEETKPEVTAEAKPEAGTDAKSEAKPETSAEPAAKPAEAAPAAKAEKTDKTAPAKPAAEKKPKSKT